MKSCTITKTNNFWIDNGIVGLYKVLRTITEKSTFYKIQLSSDELSINSLDDSSEIEELLNQAKGIVVEKYLKKTDSVGWIYKNNQFEIYRKTDFKMHLKPFFVGKTPSIEGALLVPNAKDSDLGGKGRKMTEDEFEKFERFKSINSPYIVNEKKINLTGKGFINNAPKYEIGNNFETDFIAEGPKRCSFSGKMFKKADFISGMNYPFLTGKSGELNFVSQVKDSSKPIISSLYSFVSLFSFYNLNYILQDDFKHYFILYDGNLKNLSSFYNTINRDIQQIIRSDFCSFETEIIGTVFGEECFFNFLFSIYQQIKSRLKNDERRGIMFSKIVYSLSNDGNIFRDVREYTSINELFSLFDCFENFNGNNYTSVFKNFIQFFSQRLDNGSYNTIWRNKLCEDILSFRSINKIIEWFMGDVKLKEENGGIASLDKIIEIYNNKFIKGMKTEMVDICKSIGNRIGAYCREKDDKGILFSIRNAKNKTEFLNVLAETQFRTGVSYSDSFFKSLPDNAQWEEYKALVSIFAMNSFLFKEKSQL